MTTIAFNGRYLAADTMAHRNGVPSNAESRKIDICEGFAYGAAGEWCTTLGALIAWHRAGAHPDAIPQHGKGGLIIVELSTRRFWVVGREMPYLDEERAPFTLGSGGDIALGALHAGVTAMEAVRIAARCDIHTNDTIDFIDLEFPASGVQRWDGKCEERRQIDANEQAWRESVERENPFYRVDTDEEGNPRVTLAKPHAGVIGAADLCAHGYVRRTCSTCNADYRHALSGWTNAQKTNGYA
jgi:hypothetical protein